MEGERRKRKLESEAAEEENEEQKMEKFFALIKSTKDARDMLFNKEKEKEKKTEEDHKGKSAIWTPTFQPEDFLDSGDQFRIRSKIVSTTPQVVEGPLEKKEKEVVITEREDLQEEATTPAAAVPENREEKEKGKARYQLDLNLSL